MNSTKKIDICGYTETFLSDAVDDCRVEIKGYNMYRKDRNGRGGGIIVYVNDK